MVHLAKRYDTRGQWLPDDALGSADVLRWLSIAAGETAYGAKFARVIVIRGAPGDHQRAFAIANRLLRLMQALLAHRGYLTSDHPTIADLACYSYPALAPERGIPPAPYPAMAAWLGRVAEMLGFKSMPVSAPANAQA